MPATVHASSVDLAMLLLNPVSPGPIGERYLPTPHSRHALTPAVAEYRPALQNKQVASIDAPAAVLYLPMPQSTHIASEVAPTELEYFPG